MLVPRQFRCQQDSLLLSVHSVDHYVEFRPAIVQPTVYDPEGPGTVCRTQEAVVRASGPAVDPRRPGGYRNAPGRRVGGRSSAMPAAALRRRRHRCPGGGRRRRPRPSSKRRPAFAGAT